MAESRPHRPAGAAVLLGLVVTLGAVGAPAPALAGDIPECPRDDTRDINGDGFDDAVVGNPYATVSGRAEAGSVTILYGDADGGLGEGERQVITQASVPGRRSRRVITSGGRWRWDG